MLSAAVVVVVLVGKVSSSGQDLISSWIRLAVPQTLYYISGISRVASPGIITYIMQ